MIGEHTLHSQAEMETVAIQEVAGTMAIQEVAGTMLNQARPLLAATITVMDHQCLRTLHLSRDLVVTQEIHQILVVVPVQTVRIHHMDFHPTLTQTCDPRKYSP